MGSVAECRHDLIAHELIISLDVFDRVTRCESSKNGRDIDSSPGNAGLSKPNVRVHRNARVDFHGNLHATNYIQQSWPNTSPMILQFGICCGSFHSFQTFPRCATIHPSEPQRVAE